MKAKRSLIQICLLWAAMLLALMKSNAMAQVVTNTADSGPGTLRSAITNAASGAVITFDPSLFGATIRLASTLTINTNLTIDASALPGGIQINGNGSVQIVNVASNITVFLNSLTITRGYSTNFGGGIYNLGALTLNQCTLTGNSGSDGGGIFNGVEATLTLNQCTLSGNSAGDGGGIFNLAGTAMLNQCTLSGNGAAGPYGGGIFSLGGTLTLNQCTLSGNVTLIEGGGIFTGGGTATLNQCTLSGNFAEEGGGIYNGGTLMVTNIIVAENSAYDHGGDIYNYSGSLTYGGSNLVQSVYNSGGTITGPAPLTSTPDLAPLGNYGGPTQTMPPLPGSPAIDAGSNAATNNFATDQRGLPRFVGPQVDIGAVEFQASPVVTNADSGPGSLRYAIMYVTNNATITFDPSLSGATITLASTLTINTNLTIDASALPGGLQINGNDAVTVFNVATNMTVFLNSLTITNGYSTNSGGGIYNNGTLTLTNCTLSGNSAANGGGIFNGGTDGTLVLNQCTLSGNSVSDGYGGGIFNGGTATLTNCTLSGNSASNGLGGGIFNDVNDDGLLTLNQCTLSGNSATSGDYDFFHGGGGICNFNGTLVLNQCTLSGNSQYGDGGGDDLLSGGGGICNYGGTVTLNNCTLWGNSVTDGGEFGGGGIYNDFFGTATLNQCTLSGNIASYSEGGGICNGGLLTLNQCTLSGNSADDVGEGGGIDNYGGALALTNTIVGGNSDGDIYNDTATYTAILTYGGSNLVQSVDNIFGTITGPAPLTNAPDLAPLGNYGGPTQTMPPLPGSPAIGAGDVADNTFSTDQRGYPRTQDGLIDLGAVELQSPAANAPLLGNISVPAGGGNGLQFTFTNAPAADFTVLTATNVALALTNWTVLGEVQQVAPGQYQFTDPQAATNAVRFYRVRSP